MILDASGQLWTLLAVDLEKSLCFQGMTGFFLDISGEFRMGLWCRGGDSNPHGRGPLPPQDSVSTSSTTSARQAGKPTGYGFCPEVQGESAFPLEVPRGRARLEGTEGVVAEWLGRGLQNLVQRFDPARHLQPFPSLGNPEKRNHPSASSRNSGVFLGRKRGSMGRSTPPASESR